MRVPTDRELVHRVIDNELVHGEVRDSSRPAYLDVIGRTVGDGADGVIAGCTEIELLVRGDDLPAGIAYFPTTAIHRRAAVECILTGCLPPAPEA